MIPSNTHFPKPDFSQLYQRQDAPTSDPEHIPIPSTITGAEKLRRSLLTAMIQKKPRTANDLISECYQYRVHWGRGMGRSAVNASLRGMVAAGQVKREKRNNALDYLYFV